MKKYPVKSRTWFALMSGVGLIAISASSFAGSAGQFPAFAGSGYLEVADNQQPPPPQGQKNNQSKGQQHYNQPKTYAQPQGQQHQPQPKTFVQPKTYAQPQGQQYQQQPKTVVQPKTYAQPQGQQYQQRPQTHGQPKTYVQQKSTVQPQGQQSGNQQNQLGHRYDWSTYQPGHRPPQWDQYHQHFDPHSYEANRNAEHRYHWEAYREPHGWYYRRWAYGQVFPTVFWTQDYWINSYWNFDLPDPPYGYVWVRYGPDALLVDVENGQILSVVYGVFY